MTKSTQKIPDGWREVRLEEIVEYLNRGITPLYSDEGTIVINQRCIRHGKILFENVRTTDPIKSKIAKEKKLQDEDIVICSTGVGTLGRVAQIYKVEKDMTADSHVTIVRGNSQINKRFLGFNLRGREKEIESLAEGSTGQTELQRKKLENLKVLLPPLPEQKAIAEVLSSLDDKIDLLHRQNQTLESLAQALFRKWFIDNPEREKWEKKLLFYFGNIICGKTPSKKNHEYFGGTIPFIKIPDMHGKTFIFETKDTLTEKGRDSQKNKTLPKKSICVSCIATVGLVAMNALESQTNQQINSIIPKKDEYRYFLYLFMKTSKNLLISMASGGTTTLNLNTKNFSNILVPYPEEYLIHKFHHKVSLLFDKIFTNQSQIRTLENLRNTLLPKLMSGEVRVKF